MKQYHKKRYPRSTFRRTGIFPEPSWNHKFSCAVRLWLDGEGMNIKQGAKFFGIPYKTFYAKLHDKRNWSLDEAMNGLNMMGIEFGNLSYLKY